MEWVSLVAVALALAMDAAAVSLGVGLTQGPFCGRRAFRLAFHFGLFQALMPVIGWAIGVSVQTYIAAFDHWVAFGLLAFIGARMVFAGARGDTDTPVAADPTRGWSLVVLSVATSIDALAVGLSLGVLGSPVVGPALVIGAVAAGLSAVAYALGSRLGRRAGPALEVVGGLVLIGIGVKILIEHWATGT